MENERFRLFRIERQLYNYIISIDLPLMIILILSFRIFRIRHRFLKSHDHELIGEREIL